MLATLRGEPVPSRASLLVLSIGFVAVVGLLMVYSRRQPAWRKALPVAAVATFAVMLTHLTQHSSTADQWPIELVGHHGSLLVVLVILYQDYRFALADLFLKRAVTLLAVTALAAALYHMGCCTVRALSSRESSQWAGDGPVGGGGAAGIVG